MRDDPANVDPGTRVLFAAHYLERIGDRVTNIAEDIVFLATGEMEDLNPVTRRPATITARSRRAAPIRVLVVCTGNSARSILGEALLRHLGGGRDRGALRGHAARGAVNPLTLRVLEEAGICRPRACARSP